MSGSSRSLIKMPDASAPRLSSKLAAAAAGTLALGMALLIGCRKAETAAGPAKPPEVSIATPTSQVVTEFDVFTGRTMAVQTVEVRPRITGRLDQVLFTDGADVAAGTLLFRIDDRPFKATVDRAQATIDQATARLERLKLQETRAKKLVDSNAIPEEQFEQIMFDRQEAAASLAVAMADKETAELNLDYTKITAPLAGKISRRLVDPGNLVRADETPLTTIVSTGDMYVYFDFDERIVLQLRRANLVFPSPSDRNTPSINRRIPVKLALADEDEFTHDAYINFSDNQVDAGTGTLRIRALIENPGSLLSPGLFVRVQVPIGSPHPALLIPEAALGTDQGERFVYLVNEKDEIVYRRVEIGWSTDGKRVIEKGLTPTDRVVVNGLQRVRAGTKVTAKTETAMKTAAGPTSTAPDAKRVAATPSAGRVTAGE